MFTKNNMMQPLLDASPSFKTVWLKFLDEWQDDDELPLYLVFSDLARHIDSLVIQERSSELELIFSVIEQWHLEGDSYVQEAATVGVLEDLQNTNVVKNTTPKIIETYLLPKSFEQWKKVYDFWEKGVLISK